MAISHRRHGQDKTVLSCACRQCELNWRQDKTVLSCLKMRCELSFVLDRPSCQFATVQSQIYRGLLKTVLSCHQFSSQHRPLPSARQHSSYGNCLEVKREYYQNSSVLDCVIQNVHSPQHTYMSSSYRFNRLGLSHWDPYAVRRRGCLELYYCSMVQWFRWDSSLISTTNWFPSVLWHCWFGHLACKNRRQNDL